MRALENLRNRISEVRMHGVIPTARNRLEEVTEKLRERAKERKLLKRIRGV